MAGPFYFAWAGQTIQPQQTLVTNGATHGGVLQKLSFVGDAVDQQIQHLASTSQLEVGWFYTISGPGVSDGTFFIYDTGPLVPDVNTLNLSAVTGGATSATYQITKAMVVGNVVGTITQGSNVVSLGDIDLPNGTYAISGTGIGETTVPAGTTSGSGGGSSSGDLQITLVPAAYFVYTGGGSALLYVLAATSHTYTDTDSLGLPTTYVSYTVSPQAVTATTTGDYPMQLIGMPDADWYNVTGIPSTALSELNTGAVYNISGNGIEKGSTFIAPAPGATSIELSLPTSASNFNTLLTITGPRTPDEPFDPVVHAREDEQVLGFELAQEEGNFATLTIDLKNPGTGLLATGRNLWCWFSWDSGSGVVPLFNGRLVGVPKLQAGEVAQLQFLARPDDFLAQKDAVVASLSVLPFYDPVWLAQNVNADTVLETYSSLWHIDRVSLALSASDINQGEDGIIAVGEDQAFYDAFSLAYGDPPLTSLTIKGTVSWSQQGTGMIDVTQKIVTAFHNAGSPYAKTFSTASHLSSTGYPIYGPGAGPAQYTTISGEANGGGLITCLCGDGLKNSWPRAGTTIGGGWSISTRTDYAGHPWSFLVDATRTNQGGWLKPQYYAVSYAGQQPLDNQTGNTTDETNVNVVTNPYDQYTVEFPVSTFLVRMGLEYRADRKRTETVTAVITADVQRVLSDSSEQDQDELTYTSEYVGIGVDPGGIIPIGTLAARTYFQTVRGTSSLEYLLLAARAKLRARARSVDITFAVDFATALGITLRHSVTLLDRRLAGGSATGKVKSYRLTVGDGVMYGEFTIGCTIGNGNSTSTVQGTATYAEDDYVDPGYQVIAGGTVALINDELAYQPLDEFVVVDDGLDIANITADKAVNECKVTNGLLSQLNQLSLYQNGVVPFIGIGGIGVGGTFDSGENSPGTPIDAMRQLTTEVTLDLKPVAGADFHTDFFPAVSMMAVPKTIDLAVT
jgi:hypothetical protein